MSKQEKLNHVSSLLSPWEIINPDAKTYVFESMPWAAQHQKHPALVIRPQTIASLSKVVAFLSTTDLAFAVRGHGYGNISATDVLISMTAFDTFDFDRENETVTLGAGQPWSSYYQKMDEVAPDWTIVACRTPCIGVSGSVLHGGFSWLSAEHGCASDPNNMLDAQVMKLDGSVVWASTEPDLLWALRGGGGGFGIVTSFKFRAFKYTTDIYCGQILVPRIAAAEVAKGAAAFDARSKDPKLSFFLYVISGAMLPWLDSDDDMLVIHAFCSRGEAYGRGEDGFAWALNIPGAIDMTKGGMRMKDVAALQSAFEKMKGLSSTLWSPMATTAISEDIVLRGFEWYNKVQACGESLSKNIYLLYELRSTTTDHIQLSDTAWPRQQGTRHVLLLGVGTDPDAPKEEVALAEKMITMGPAMIQGADVPIHYVPNGIEHFHNVREVYGEHYERLCTIKARYDPKNQLGGFFTPVAMNGSVSS